jgi:hypothetical protein
MKAVRICARKGCGKEFKPDTSTRYFHDESCAAMSLFERMGLKSGSKFIEKEEERAEQREVIRKERSERMRALRAKRHVSTNGRGAMPVQSATPLLSLGTRVRYLGGSRAALGVGSIGVVCGYYAGANWLKAGAAYDGTSPLSYAIQFDNKRTSMLTKFVIEEK